MPATRPLERITERRGDPMQQVQSALQVGELHGVVSPVIDQWSA
jgi:LPS O-antigen subunit length determinant protein (WzzB/FepE family)